MKKINLKTIFKDILQGFLVILVTAIVALSLRIFLFASFVIPSPSMSPTLDAGDYILVNKLIPGPRVYKNTDFLKGARVETHRFKGIRSVRRNDVLVFNFPYTDWSKIALDLNVVYVKRCIAIPGDTFYIDNGIYKVKIVEDTLGYLPYQQQLSKRRPGDFPSTVYHCFPFDSIHYNWTVKDLGPLYVPMAGDNVAIDTINFSLYKHLIEYETDLLITIREGKVFLDEQVLEQYKFKLNYYFMSGDWVFDSRDSRYWGLLPEDHIIGKAVFIWQSKDRETGKYRWERFFNTIK